MLRLTMMLALVSVCLSTTAAVGSPIEAFVGRWIGETVQAPDNSLDTETIGIEIEKSDGGFSLSWRDLARNDQGRPNAEPLDALFVSTNRPGVFEYAPKSGSFLDRMFASPSAGNPLEGDAIIWARCDAEALAVYSLTISGDGGFQLDHYTWTRTEDGLALRYRGKTHDIGKEFMVEGRLVPAGG